MYQREMKSFALASFFGCQTFSSHAWFHVLSKLALCCHQALVMLDGVPSNIWPVILNDVPSYGNHIVVVYHPLDLHIPA